MRSKLLGNLLHLLRRSRLALDPAAQDVSDGALLDRYLAARDDAAFAALVERHGPMVLGVCQRVLGDAHSAEDAFQATFFVLARRADSIRKQASLGSWLFGVAIRIASKARAQSAAQKEREIRVAAMSDSQPLDETTWQELRSILDEEIDRLPEKCRAVVVLCHLEGKSYEQAAQELGCPKSTLASRLNKAHELLRGQLVRRGLALSGAALTTALAEKATAASVSALLTVHAIHAAALVAAGECVTTGILSAQALLLAEEAMKGMIGIKTKLVLLLLAFGLTVGVGFAEYGAWVEQAPPKGDENRPPVVKQEPRKKVTDGDPLPPGAVARLGKASAHRLVSLQFLPDGKTVLTGSGPQLGALSAVQMWDAATGKKLSDVTLPDSGLVDLLDLVSPDGKLLARAAARPKGPVHVNVIDLASAKVIGNIVLSKREVGVGLCFSPDSKTLAISQPTKRTLELYDVGAAKLPNNPAPLRSLDVKPGTGADKTGFGARFSSQQRLAFSADGKMVAWYEKDRFVPQLILLDTMTGKQIGQIAPLPMPRYPAGAFGQGLVPITDKVAFSPDGRCLAVDMEDGTVELYELVTGQPRVAFGKKAEKKEVGTSFSCFAFSSDGTSFAESGPDGIVHVWNILTGKELKSFKGHATGVNVVAFTRDGKALASAGDDSTALIWDLSRLKRPVVAVKALQPGDLDKHWRTLADNDAAKAYDAIGALAAAPEQTVVYLNDRLKPARPDEAKTIGLFLQGDALRNHRAVEVLERISTPAARQVLQTLADGAPGALLTVSAQAALKR